MIVTTSTLYIYADHSHLIRQAALLDPHHLIWLNKCLCKRTLLVDLQGYLRTKRESYVICLLKKDLMQFRSLTCHLQAHHHDCFYTNCIRISHRPSDAQVAYNLLMGAPTMRQNRSAESKCDE